MNSTQRTALIVDDEKSIQYLLSSQLDQWGYSCTAVSSGREALECVSRREFDVMLLDVKMPGMSGLEVLERFQTEHPDTCVIMLSALVDKSVFANAMKLGADDYVVKPCDPEELSIRLRLAQERREQARRGEPPPEQGRPDFNEITGGLIGVSNQFVDRETSSREGAGTGPESVAESLVNIGQELDPVCCPSCGHCNPTDALFCNLCGSRMDTPCPKCAHGNPPISSFCNRCGQRL